MIFLHLILLSAVHFYDFHIFITSVHISVKRTFSATVPKGSVSATMCFPFLFAISSILMETFRFIHPFCLFIRGASVSRRWTSIIRKERAESNAIRHLHISHDRPCLSPKICIPIVFPAFLLGITAVRREFKTRLMQNVDHYTLLGNCPPTPPLSQH